jgi:hypothetical protein
VLSLSVATKAGVRKAKGGRGLWVLWWRGQCKGSLWVLRATRPWSYRAVGVTAANYVRLAGMAIDARTVLVGDSEGTRGGIVGVSQIRP